MYRILDTVDHSKVSQLHHFLKKMWKEDEGLTD
jgi:hypothetical protein